MLRLFDHIAPEVRDKYAEAYARKLSPRYKLRPQAHVRCANDRYFGPDARGLRVAGHWSWETGVERYVRPCWRFTGWQDNQDTADAFADHVGGTLGNLFALRQSIAR